MIYGYTRVSTGRQELSLAIQSNRIRGWLHSRGVASGDDWDIVEDDGCSASSLNRPELSRILRKIKSGDTLVVVKLDRLTRRVRDLLDLMELSQREGWAIVSIEESLDTTTPIGRAIVKVLATFAELEREQVSERTKDALAERKSQNRLVSRFTPFGWRLADGNWDASKSPVNVRQDILVEHEDEQSIIDIVRRSDAFTPSGVVGALKSAEVSINPRTGKLVNARTIEKIRASLAVG